MFSSPRGPASSFARGSPDMKAAIERAAAELVSKTLSGVEVGRHAGAAAASLNAATYGTKPR